MIQHATKSNEESWLSSGGIINSNVWKVWKVFDNRYVEQGGIYIERIERPRATTIDSYR